jgi:hypothetical protein
MASIDDIYKIGDDALANMYDLKFDLTFEGSKVSTLSFKKIGKDDFVYLRCTEVEIPEFSNANYEVHWRANKIMKPNGKTDFAGTMTTSFRMDKQYQLYRDIYVWNKKILNPVSGVIASDDIVENYRANAYVRVYDPKNENDQVGIWTIKGMYPQNCPSISLSADNGDPIIVSITWNILSAEYSDSDTAGTSLDLS